MHCHGSTVANTNTTPDALISCSAIIYLWISADAANIYPRALAEWPYVFLIWAVSSLLYYPSDMSRKCKSKTALLLFFLLSSSSAPTVIQWIGVLPNQLQMVRNKSALCRVNDCNFGLVYTNLHLPRQLFLIVPRSATSSHPTAVLSDGDSRLAHAPLGLIWLIYVFCISFEMGFLASYSRNMQRSCWLINPEPACVCTWCACLKSQALLNGGTKMEIHLHFSMSQT